MHENGGAVLEDGLTLDMMVATSGTFDARCARHHSQKHWACHMLSHDRVVPCKDAQMCAQRSGGRLWSRRCARWLMGCAGMSATTTESLG